MKIRNRLTLLFIFIVALIITAASISIYFFSADYRVEDFYNRLLNKATNTAKLLIEVDEINAQLLEKIEKDNPTTLPNEKIIIYNFRNEILYSSDKENVISVNNELLDQIRLEGEVRIEQQEYEILGFLYTDRFDRFVVIAGGIDIYGKGKLRNLKTILFIVFGASIVVVLVAAWIYAGRALKPISNVINQADEITISSLNLRIDEGNGKDEIAQLAKTFNVMLDRLESSFEVQKNFIANASHELRTPLTVITGQLEVTLLNERSHEEYIRTIRSVLDDIKHLNMLSNRLLLLAQTSQEKIDQASFKSLRIDELLWQSKDDLLKRYSNYTINIDFDSSLDDERKFIIEGDSQLIKVALINLMDNGCKYSDSHSVSIMVKAYKKHITLTFTNSGKPIPQQELQKIFEPFHRGTNVQKIRGHGIGLSLVSKIVKIHSGQIKVQSKDNWTSFIVRFPLISPNI